ncbi:sensor histidine kinase [Dyadobacter frigoris]|uniref:Sensor histidine kinase n=1 Tax=Dyadobacter frigoris TaxID=2576211 RepID=A0A4U6D0Z3_9BACT|nr:sensor histidine kinase [Dyadobacter frigoris]TKT87434.1 sensor histidine kinase [Dyadobacter frigoris]GLU52316.1 histidine kinase [Dyadobacter frigoris]
MKQSGIQFFIHVFLVFAFLALPYIFAPTGFPGLAELERNSHERTNFVSYLLMLAFFYANYYYLIPRFYFNKKYISYATFILGSFLIILFFIYTLDKTPGAPRPFPHRPPHAMRFDKPPAGFDNSQTLFLFLVGLVVSFALRINDRLKRSEQEKLTTELSYLKAQINPHFLFNTLNSIYSLAIEKSDRTADAVVMLSSLMRYVIRDASESLVPLNKEIEYIKNYVSLQKFRLDDTVLIEFQVDGNYLNKQIAPLILISFIENAFKYGVNPEQKSLIKITITADRDELILHVCNNKVRINHSEESSGGIGINNTRTRLQLLYPAKHQLIIEDNAENFIIDLKLNLS